MAEDSQTSSRRVHHTWTKEENSVLIECLLDIAESWKSDNGFRPGINKQLEKMIHDRIPGCHLRAVPHIGSRLKLLKRNYLAICQMKGASGSGFGWNEQECMIVVEKHIYDEWVKSHPSARGLYNKPFPYFHQLGAIFGKDVATGQDVEVPVDHVIQMETDGIPQYNDTGSIADDFMQEMRDNSEPPVADPVSVTPTTEVPDQPTASTNASKNRKKRPRAEDTVIEAVADAIKDLTQSYREGNEHMGNLVKLQTDEKQSRLSIYNALKMIGGLSGLERAQIVRIMAKDSHLTDIFMEMADEDRYDLVASLLQNPN